MQFESPAAFWLFLIFPFWLAWFWWRGAKTGNPFHYGSLAMFKGQPWTFWIVMKWLLIPMKLAGLTLIIIALARPQLVNTQRVITSEGVDIMLVIDVSGSMRAIDLTPNRLAAAKEVAADFVSGRVADRIGLVVFAGEAFTQCPLTLDYPMLKRLIQTTIFDEINPGTAVGMALATAINRLRDSDAKSKIVILLTDGRSNQGTIDPITAADLALSNGIKVYTIGVGTRGMARIPVKDNAGNIQYVTQEVDVDDETLTQVAQMTAGKYYRATDNKTLADIYAEINALEKTKVEFNNYYQYEERYAYFLLPGLVLLFIEYLLAKTRCREFISELRPEINS